MSSSLPFFTLRQIAESCDEPWANDINWRDAFLRACHRIDEKKLTPDEFASVQEAVSDLSEFEITGISNKRVVKAFGKSLGEAIANLKGGAA